MLFELLYIRIFMLVIDVLFETNKRKGQRDREYVAAFIAEQQMPRSCDLKRDDGSTVESDTMVRFVCGLCRGERVQLKNKQLSSIRTRKQETAMDHRYGEKLTLLLSNNKPLGKGLFDR